jgi:hypothetical protein
MSSELETLDQIVESPLPLAVVRRFYSDDGTFAVGIHALLRNGDVRLTSGGVEVPSWRWRELFEAGAVYEETSRFRLEITDKGIRTLGSEN